MRQADAWLAAMRWATCAALWGMFVAALLLPEHDLPVRAIAPLLLAAAIRPRIDDRFVPRVVPDCRVCSGYNRAVKTVGTRQVDGTALDDQGRLARTAVALRGGGFALPGVYRFASFEEAETWMLQMMRRPRARRNPKTSPASVAR